MQGICGWCQDAIVRGELFFTDGHEEVHDACMDEWLFEKKGRLDLAWQYGLIRTVKGEEDYD